MFVAIIRLDLEARPRDRRISILKLEESDIPTDPPGCLRKTNSLSEFQDHPELQQFILVRQYVCLFVYLFTFCLFIYVFIVCLFVYFICLCICLFVCLFVCVFVY